MKSNLFKYTIAHKFRMSNRRQRHRRSLHNLAVSYCSLVGLFKEAKTKGTHIRRPCENLAPHTCPSAVGWDCFMKHLWRKTGPLVVRGRAYVKTNQPQPTDCLGLRSNGLETYHTLPETIRVMTSIPIRYKRTHTSLNFVHYQRSSPTERITLIRAR
jgi:hypothetical protein